MEGFWWQDDVEGVDYTNKSAFNWISVIRLPDFISKADFDWTVETATKKKKLDCSSAEYLTIDEGLCVQIMHIGSFDNEPATVDLMDAYLEQNGYVNDINRERLHHEIYMSDAGRVAPEKWKTVAPAGMIGASNFFELAVAIAVFGTTSAAALATTVGVLTEVPVMLMLVRIAIRRKESFYDSKRKSRTDCKRYKERTGNKSGCHF